MSENPDKELRRSFRQHMRKKRRKANKRALRKWFSFNRKEKESFRPIRHEDISRREALISQANRREEQMKAFRSLQKNQDFQQYFLKSIALSTLASIISFLFLYIVYQISTIVIAGVFSIPMGWRQFSFTYGLSGGSPLYTKIAIITIFLSPAVFCLVIGLLARSFLKPGIPRTLWMLIFWSGIHGINLFFGAVIAGILTRTEMIYATTWFFLSDAYDMSELMLIMVSITSLMLAGYWFTKTAIYIPRLKIFKEKGYLQMNLISEIILPFIVSTAFLIIISFPAFYLPYVIKILTGYLLMVPLMIRYRILVRSSAPFF